MASLLASLASRPVYLYDLEVFRPPAAYKVNQDEVIKLWEETQRYSPEDIDFQRRVYARSGLSPADTHLPPNLHPAFVGNDCRTDMDSAAAECRMAVTGAVSGLLRKTGLRPTDIDILVTTCSIYCPTPSMASMVVNAFGLRRDVQAYHLGGMGCANGVVAVNLVADLLKAHPNSNALFVTTETTTPAYYPGTDRHRLVTNLLFRMGAAAMLLTNKPTMAARGPRLPAPEPGTVPPGAAAAALSGPRYGPGAKYVLQHRVRVHLGQSDEALSAIYYGPDAEGINGIFLGKNVVKEASRALAVALTKVAPRVLTWRQLAEAGMDVVRQRLAAPRSGPRRPRRGAGKDDGGAAAAAASDAGSAYSRGSTSSSVSSGSSDGSGDRTAATAGDAAVGGGGEDSKGATAAAAAAAARTTVPSSESCAPAPVAAAAAAAPAAAPARAPYRPNFQESTIRHFLLHAGGAKVLDGLGEALQLDATRLAPSRDVLRDYGNISSSTTWYTLACVETLGGVRRGERVMQVGVGSGIKCGVNVWKALRDVREVHGAWAHRLSPEERRAVALERSLDVSHGAAHLATRALFAVLMLLAALAMHALMLHRA